MDLLHNKICLIGNSHTSQFDENNLTDVLYGYGASIFGLLNENSVLRLKDEILNYQKNHPEKILVFFLGQTDIEFIYYYRCAQQNKKIDINLYIDDLIHKYIYFIKTYITNNCILLGINPNVIKDNIHIFNVNFRASNNSDPNGTHNQKVKYEDYLDIYNDSYETRFSYNIQFNNKLKSMCIENNIKYCDLNKHIIDENGNVRNEYLHANLDHHLKPTRFLFLCLLEEIKRLTII